MLYNLGELKLEFVIRICSLKFVILLVLYPVLIMCFTAAGASENVDCSLTSEIKSNTDMIEIVVSSENSVGGTCEGVPKLAATDMVNPVADGAFSLNEKNNADVMPQIKLLLEVNSTQSINGSTNGVQVESADITQYATSSDVKMSQEKKEENINVFTYPLWDDELGNEHPQNKYEDVKEHEGVSLQNSPSLHSSEGLKQKRDLKDSFVGENNFLTNQSQLSERRKVLKDVHVLDSSMKEQNNIDLVDEEIKEIDNVAVDGRCRGANVGIGIKTKQPSNLHLEVKPSSGLHMGEIEKCDITDAQYKEGPIAKDTSLSKYANSNFECPILSEVVMDRTISTRKGVECKDRDPLSGAEQDIKADEELIVKPAQCISVVEDARDREPGKKVFGCTDVPVYKDKLASSAIHASVEPGSCFDSFSFKGDSDSPSVSGIYIHFIAECTLCYRKVL